ncbi:MAG: glycoside hydrolase family 127 protein [bacterium]
MTIGVSWEEVGVVSTARSPFCKLRPVPIRAVRMGSGFWKARMDTNTEVTLSKQMEKLRGRGTLENFLRVYGKSDADFRGLCFDDSDLYKWVEAASWTLQSYDAPEIKRMIDEVIEIIEPAQGEDGYLNTYFQKERASERWTNLEQMHELYCAGHLFQAAVAHHRSTGEDRLLNIARKFADHICGVFGPGKREGHPGHPEVEMGLIELYRETGERRYLETAGYFIDYIGGKDMREILGHAVRALYFCSGMTDYYAETGDGDYLRALESLWKSMTETKMYVTGAVGGRVRSESFGREFELPNENAYAETCAAIASAFWNWRMLGIGGEARFADLMELTMYNSILSGISLDGMKYFYVNPHASNGRPTGDPWYPHERAGIPTRQEWFKCACCPPNIARVIASLPGYFYSTDGEGVWVHLYDNNTLNWHLRDGARLSLSQRTKYPWDGGVEIEVSPEAEREFKLRLRIPGWCPKASVSINGRKARGSPRPGSYFEIERLWRKGDKVVLDMTMDPVLMISNPMAAENRCSVAVKRGPIVYCFEGVDNPGISVRQARLKFDPRNASRSLEAEFCPDLLGGVVVLTGEGAVPTEEWGPLYRPFEERPIKTKPVVLKAIPYYAWDNRGPSEMTVWVQMDKSR